MNILIVDDSATQRVIIKSIVQQYNGIKSVVDVTDGLKALDLISSDDIDLVFSDINMEPMSGLELIDKSLKLKPDTLFAFITSHLTDTMEKKASDAGGSFYITKPITQEKIENVLKQVISDKS